MTLNLRIANLREFSNVLNACSAPVELTTADGAVHRFPDDGAAGLGQLLQNGGVGTLAVVVFGAAASLCSRKPKNGTRLSVAVRIHAPNDYFNIVSYYAGDC